MGLKKCNFSVKHNPKRSRGQSVEQQNAKLVRMFIKKFKESGIVKELRDKRYPVTRGMKRRRKKSAGKRRAQKNNRNQGFFIL